VSEQTLTATHQGVEIEYDEYKDRWTFELHGKERVAESLANAKKAIDAPDPKEKATFVSKKALLVHSYRGVQVVTVTSEAADSGNFWVVNSKGARSKEGGSALMAYGPANVRLYKESAALDAEASLLSKKAQHKRKEMSPFVASAEASL
jgi:hypothetical protein